MKKLILPVLVAVVAQGLLTARADEPRRLHYTSQTSWWWETDTFDEYITQPDESVVTNKVKWQNGSIAVVPYKHNCFGHANIDCYGIEYDSTADSWVLMGSVAGGTLSIGAGGLLVNQGGSCPFWLRTNQALSLTASQTWRSGAVKGGANVGYRNGASGAGDPTAPLYAADDIVWTIDNINVTINTLSSLAACDVVVKNSAQLKIGADSTVNGSCLNARTLTVDNGTITAYRDWAPEGYRNVASALKMANGARCTVSASGVYDIDSLEITEGLVTLDYALALTKKVPLVVDADATLTITTVPASGGFTTLTGSGTVNLGCDISALGDYSAFAGKIVVSQGIVKFPPMKDWPDGFTVDTAGNGIVYVTSEEEFDSSRIGGTGRYINCDRQRTELTRCSGGGGYWIGNYWSDGEHDNIAWQQDEIATIGNLNLSLRGEVFAYQVNRTAGGTFLGNCSTIYGDVFFHLGSGGFVMSSGTSVHCWFDEHSTFDLTGSQQWTTDPVDAGSRANIVLCSESYTYRGNSRMTTAEGIHWDIMGNLAVAFDMQGELENAYVSVTAPAVLNIARQSKFDGYLNCRRLRVYDGASVTCGVHSELPAGARAIARDIEFDDGGSLALSSNSPLDVDTLEVNNGTVTISGSGSLAASGTAIVTVESGATLALNAAFSNAVDRPGALLFNGGGTVRIGTTSTNTYRFDAASVEESFYGTVEVAAGAVIAVSGPVDFQSLVFLGNATVLVDPENGDKIVDWSKVTFPASGTITIKCNRPDAVRPAEEEIDFGMDFAEVAAADRAKIAVSVESRLSGSPLVITAAPSFVGANLRLKATLTSSMSKDNNYNGELVWVGRDWADATELANWVIFPNSAAAATYDPDNHPATLEALASRMNSGGIYGSSSWKIDLCGRVWKSANTRANSANEATSFAIRNGTLETGWFMVSAGRLDIESGATLLATGYRNGGDSDSYFVANSTDGNNPFVMEVHPNAVAVIGEPGNRVITTTYNQRFNIDAGGRLVFQPWKHAFAGANTYRRTYFTNEGELSFPIGLAMTNNVSTTVGVLLVRQLGGTLSFDGTFELVLGDGCTSTNAVEFTGGTTVFAKDVSFSNWEMRVQENADFALEIPAGGDFATTGFAWANGTKLEKKGDGVLRLDIDDEVDSLALKLTGGTLVVEDVANVGAVDVDFDGGALGIGATGSEHGLLAMNEPVAGTCRIKDIAPVGVLPTDVAFLTVPAENDPLYTSANVQLIRKNGGTGTGIITKENVTVGDVACVRYRVTFMKPSLFILVK